MAGVKAIIEQCTHCGKQVYADEGGEFIFEFFGQIFCSVKCRDSYIVEKGDREDE